MKKFLSFSMMFFLMLSVTALVGCNGLWDFDDDDDAVTPPVTFTVKGSVDSLGGTISNVRAAVSSTDLKVQAYNIKNEALGSPVSLTNNNGVFEYECKFSPKNTSDYYYIRVFATNFDMRVVLGTLTTAQASSEITGKTVNAQTTAQAWIIQTELVEAQKTNPSAVPQEPSAVTVPSDVTTSFETAIKNGDVFTKTITEIDPNLKVYPTAFAIANGTSVNLNHNGTVTLSATFVPAYATEKNVTWAIKSGAEYITLNGAVVTAGTTDGTAVITATVKDKDGADLTPQEISIVVAKVVIPVTSVTITGTGIANNAVSIYVGDSLNLGTTIVPGDATNQTVTWSQPTGTDANLTLTPNADGTATIKGVAPTTTAVTITATAGGVSGELTVTVVAKPITPVTIDLGQTFSTSSDNYQIWVENFGSSDLTGLVSSVTKGDVTYEMVKDTGFSSASRYVLTFKVPAGETLVTFDVSQTVLTGAQVPSEAIVKVFTDSGAAKITYTVP